jgi:hypothetical protein
MVAFRWRLALLESGAAALSVDAFVADVRAACEGEVASVLLLFWPVILFNDLRSEVFRLRSTGSHTRAMCLMQRWCELNPQPLHCCPCLINPTSSFLQWWQKVGDM